MIELLHHAQNFIHQGRIERAGRLVVEQNFGIHGQGAGNGRALLLAARELDRKMVSLVAQAHLSKGFARRTLLDLNVTKVYENGLSSRFRQLVFQPLTDAGAALARQHSFVFQADRQAVQLRGARVYRQNGKVDEAIESGVGAADSPELTMYTSARTFYVLDTSGSMAGSRIARLKAALA